MELSLPFILPLTQTITDHGCYPTHIYNINTASAISEDSVPHGPDSLFPTLGSFIPRRVRNTAESAGSLKIHNN